MAKTQTERAIVDLVINGQQAKTTLKEISLEVTRARSELNKMRETDNPQLYQQKLQAMHALVGAQREMTARINDTSTAWGRFKKEMATVATGVVGGNLITFLLQSLVQLIPSTIDRTMKLRDAFADIEKATGLSSEGVKKLNKELKEIDTRTTNQELRDIAVAGGQLGVANDQLLDFVSNVDKAVVALGDEFSGGVDQVAKEIGGIAKLFDETRAMEIGPAINNIGSALNELGAAGSATSPVVAEFTTRMGQLGNLAPKLAETLGLGAALQELGLTAEIAASGLSGLMLTAANKSDLFAQHLGLSKKAVEELINTSPNDFLMRLAKSFEGMAPVQVAQRLKELKVESQESIKVMSLLADQTDFVAKKQALAAQAMADGTSLTEEFNKKNHELARDLKELNEWFNSLLSSEGLQEFLVSAIHNTVQFIKVLPQLGSWLSKNAEWFTIIGVPAILAYNAALIKATASAVANTVAEGYRRVAYEVGFRWLVIQAAATKAYAFATGVLTGQITLQTAAVTIARTVWTAFTAVLLTNPIGIVVGALAALVGGLKYFSEHTERALAVERKLNSLRQQNKLSTELAHRAQQELNEKIAKYNDLSADEQANLKKTIALKQIEANARLANVYARAREIARQNAEPNAWQRAKVKVANTFSSTDELKKALKQQEEDNKREAYENAKLQGGAEERKAELEGYKKMMADIAKIDADRAKEKAGGKLNTITDPEDAKRAAKKKQSDAQREADELEKLLADSRERIMAGERTEYDREVAAFAEKYSRMYDLAKDNEAKINEIKTLSLLEWAEIEKRYFQKKEEEERKQREKDNEIGYATAMRPIEERRTKSLHETDLNESKRKTNPNAAKENELRFNEQQQRLQIEQQFLMAQLLMQQTFAQDAIKTQEELTANWNAQEKLRADATAHYNLEMANVRKQALGDALNFMSNNWTETLDRYKEFWKKSSDLQKAGLIASKAWALAEIGINLARELSAVNLAAARANILIPGSGLGIKIGGYATAIGSAALRTAAVLAVSPQAPGFAEGGYTGLREVHPGVEGASGFVEFPTLFNLGKRSYVAGEAGREFVVSNKALQNPVVADFTRMLDVAQKTENYGLLNAGTGSGSATSSALSSTTSQPTLSGMSQEMGLAILKELERNRVAMEVYANRPIILNYRTFEEFVDQVQEVRQVNTL